METSSLDGLPQEAVLRRGRRRFLLALHEIFHLIKRSLKESVLDSFSARQVIFIFKPTLVVY